MEDQQPIDLEAQIEEKADLIEAKNLRIDDLESAIVDANLEIAKLVEEVEILDTEKRKLSDELAGIEQTDDESDEEELMNKLESEDE